MKKYIFLAASALALASCQSDDFLGNTPGNTPSSANSAIKFDGNAGKISRATSNEDTPAEMLGYEFKIYGVKSGTNSGSDYKPVFQNYLLWYDDANKNTTTNKSGWEYVGETGKHGTGDAVDLQSDQYIKFWDYSSADYRFVAGAPSNKFTFNSGTNNTLESATITGLGGHINANPTGTAKKFEPIYVADPIVVAKNKYQQAVTFNFVRQQSMVRVGIYETIPGYDITDIKFYKYDDDNQLKVSDENNIILTSATAEYFVGGEKVDGTITYNWPTDNTTNPTYSLVYGTTGLTKSKNWYGGALAQGVKAETSTHTNVSELYGTDNDMAANGYFTVMPTLETNASAILIKCNYTLTSKDKSKETIKVTGATAAIPAAYSKWETNTRYTYLFKISDKTNGTTGDPEKDDPAGLYPITFEAAVKETKEGTITTFTTPSITTKQDGSVVENGGIKYVTDKPITVKVTNSTKGKDLTLSGTAGQDGYIDVYKFTDPITEAEAQVKGVTTGTNVTGSVNMSENSFAFTPKAVGYYVIRYLTKEENQSGLYTYKVVHVEAAN